MAKKSIAATAKSLTVNFGKLALDAQRVALMEMVGVYERTARAAKKVGRKSSKTAKATKKRAAKTGKKAAKAVKTRAKKAR
jgi:hypothetical protein